jgi:hypothetical protein
MGPFDYSLNVQRPDEAFAAGLQGGNAILAAQTERAKMEAAIAEKQAQQQILGLVNTELQGVMGSNDPLAYVAAQRRVLEKGGAKAAELFTGQYKTFDDSTKNAAFDAGQRAFALATTGDAMGAKRSLEQSADAFERVNPVMAKALRDAATRMEANPEQAKTTLGMLLAANDPDKFKKFGEAAGLGSQGDTPFIKELIAEGLQPGSPEFTAALKAKRDKDPFISVPGVGLFLRKDVEAAAGGDVAPSIPERAIRFLRANPATRAAFDEEYGAGSAARILGG